MLEANIGMLIGFGIVLFTIIVVGLLTRWTLADAIWQTPERKARAIKGWRRAFAGAILLAIASFAIAFAWTGIKVAPTGEQPEGTLDTGGALKLETTTGENRPEDRPARIKEGTELQKEGQKELNEFRKDFFKSKQQEKPK